MSVTEVAISPREATIGAAEDRLITEAMAGPQDRLSKDDSDALMEFLWQLRSGGELTDEQRRRLVDIVKKVRASA